VGGDVQILSSGTQRIRHWRKNREAFFSGDIEAGETGKIDLPGHRVTMKRADAPNPPYKTRLPKADEGVPERWTTKKTA
jgi:hypothetical protein